MRPSNARMSSIAGGRSTGLSSRFSVNGPDFKRYSVEPTNTGQRHGMAPPRAGPRPPTTANSDEQARELVKFFQENGAVFPCDYQRVRKGPDRTLFRQWFEFIVKKLNHNYELPDHNNAVVDEVPTLLGALNYPCRVTNSTMTGINAPHQWPAILNFLDWLRRLVIANREDECTGNTEKQDYTFKYAYECYKQDKNVDADFSNILALMRELIISSSSYDELNEELETAKNTVDDYATRIDDENASIAELEREIAGYEQQLEQFAQSEDDMKAAMNSMETKIGQADSEINQLEGKLQNLRTEHEALAKQVASQPMSSHEAQDLLQQRQNLHIQLKDKGKRHAELVTTQRQVAKRLTDVATQKSENYRRFCAEISQHTRACDVDNHYRNFELALFGGNAAADSLRVSQLGDEITSAFRHLMNAIRSAVQRRSSEIDLEGLKSKLRMLQNANLMLQQKIQQIEQRNEMELKGRQVGLRDIQNQLKVAQNECEKAGKSADDALQQYEAVRTRVDAQADLMRQIDSRLANFDNEETALMNDFADYMLEASARFDSASNLNGGLQKQKEMLLGVCTKIIDHTQAVLKDVDKVVAEEVAYHKDKTAKLKDLSNHGLF